MRTILVVEDSPLLLQMLFTVIRAEELQVIEAGNAFEVLGMTDGRHLDMVITDLIMPGRDGIELTREIRSKSAYKKVPIVMLTTQSSAKLKQAGKEAGITAWVV